MDTWFVDLTERWFRHLRRRGRKLTTVATYGSVMRDLGRWLAAAGVAGALELEPEHLHRWQDDFLLRHPTAAATQAVAASAVRSFLRWAGREPDTGIPRGMAEYVDQVDVPDKEPLTLEPDVLRRILEHYQGRPPRLAALEWHRDRALFWFLATSGARIHEALQLDRGQVNRRLVRQKGGSQKRLVISAQASEWLETYLRVRGADEQPALWVHVGAAGGRFRLDERAANAIWAELARRLDVPRFTSRHLRGTSATELQELGASSALTAKHLGHHGGATIHRYTDLRQTHQQAMVDRLDELIPAPPPAPRPPRRRRRFRVVKRPPPAP